MAKAKAKAKAKANRAAASRKAIGDIIFSNARANKAITRFIFAYCITMEIRVPQGNHRGCEMIIVCPG